MAVSHTQGPWEALDGQVWSRTKDHPVADVISGEWGDSYPALRLVDSDGNATTPGGLDVKAGAYMERSAYGSVDPEEARANAKLIAAAPEMLEALRAFVGARHEYGYGQLGKINAALCLACAAIEKAEGREG